MADKLCTIEGCGQPRYKNYRYCHAHAQTYWREQAEKGRRKAGKKPIGPYKAKCPICGRTPAQAAAWAALGVTCAGCHTPPRRLTAPKIAEPPGQSPALLAGYPALLLDAQRDTLAQVRVITDDERSQPQPADLRRQMLAAHDSGVPVLRRHYPFVRRDDDH